MRREAVAPLGVPAGQARLVPHDPGWAALFLRERERIASTLGPAALAGCIAPLVGLGYRDLGWRSEQVGHFLERTGAAGRTHCIHLLEVASPHWRDYLRLREHLRGDAAARAACESLKQALATAHADDRKAYTRGKHALVRQLQAVAPSAGT